MGRMYAWGPNLEAEAGIQGCRMKSLRALYRKPSKYVNTTKTVKEQTPASSQSLVSETRNVKKEQNSLGVPSPVKPEADFKSDLTATLNAQNVFVKLESTNEAKPNSKGAVKDKNSSSPLSITPEGGSKNCDLRRGAGGNAARCLFPALNKDASQNLPPTNANHGTVSQTPFTPVGSTGPKSKPFQQEASVSDPLKARSLQATCPSTETLATKSINLRSKRPRSPSNNPSSSKLRASATDSEGAGPSNRDRSDEVPFIDLTDTSEDNDRKPQLECLCCYDVTDHFDSVCCPAGHRLCKTCVQTQVKEVLKGDGNNSSQAGLDCLAGDCEFSISIDVLKSPLSEDDHGKFDDLCATRSYLGQTYVKPLQLLACSRCNERHSVEGKRPRKFPEHKSLGHAEPCPAMCIRCKEEWGPTGQHKCKKDEDVDKPINIAEAKTEAMSRLCPWCAKRYVKDQGCNNVKCNDCARRFCFTCRVEIKWGDGYSHFCVHGSEGTSKKCSQCGKCKKSQGKLGNKKRVQGELAEVEATYSQSSKAPRLS